MKAGLCMCAGSLGAAIGASVTLAMLSHPSAALAQTDTSSREQADALFEQGKTALKAGDWKTACTDFQRSRELDESASTVVKIARCHEHDGHFVQALAEYHKALALIRARPASDTHARDLESLIQASSSAVEGRLAHLRIRLNPQPSRAVVLVDGQPVSTLENSQSEVVVPLDPGQHTVRIEAVSYTALPSPVELAERQQLDLIVTLTPTENASAVPAPEPKVIAPLAPVAPTLRFPEPEANPHANTGRTQRVIGYVTGGAGIALGVVAGYFGMQTRSHVDDARADNHCDSSYRCDRRGLELIDAARDQQRNAIIAGISGGILVTTGIVLIATAPAQRSGAIGPEKKLALTVSPFGAAVGGQW